MIASNWKPPGMVLNVLHDLMPADDARLLTRKFIDLARELKLRDMDSPGRVLLSYAHELLGNESYVWLSRLTRSDAIALGRLCAASRVRPSAAGEWRSHASA